MNAWGVLFLAAFVVVAILLMIGAVFLLRLSGRWLDRISGSREVAVKAAYQAGWNGAVDMAGPGMFRAGEQYADKRWRDWYRTNFPDDADGVAGSA